MCDVGSNVLRLALTQSVLVRDLVFILILHFWMKVFNGGGASAFKPIKSRLYIWSFSKSRILYNYHEKIAYDIYIVFLIRNLMGFSKLTVLLHVTSL